MPGISELHGGSYEYPEEVFSLLDITRVNTHDAPVSLADLLHEERMRRGISQREAGELCGSAPLSAQQNFDRWEKGGSPGRVFWAKIARFVGISRDEVRDLAQAAVPTKNDLARRLDRLEQRMEEIDDRQERILALLEGRPVKRRR